MAENYFMNGVRVIIDPIYVYRCYSDELCIDCIFLLDKRLFYFRRQFFFFLTNISLTI